MMRPEFSSGGDQKVTGRDVLPAKTDVFPRFDWIQDLNRSEPGSRFGFQCRILLHDDGIRTRWKWGSGENANGMPWGQGAWETFTSNGTAGNLEPCPGLAGIGRLNRVSIHRRVVESWHGQLPNSRVRKEMSAGIADGNEVGRERIRSGKERREGCLDRKRRLHSGGPEAGPVGGWGGASWVRAHRFHTTPATMPSTQNTRENGSCRWVPATTSVIAAAPVEMTTK